MSKGDFIFLNQVVYLPDSTENAAHGSGTMLVIVVSLTTSFKKGTDVVLFHIEIKVGGWLSVNTETNI